MEGIGTESLDTGAREGRKEQSHSTTHLLVVRELEFGPV